MKGNGLLILGAIGIGAYFVFKSGNANAATTTTGIIDLSTFEGDYGDYATSNLQNLQNVLNQQSLTPLQIKFMLSQALQETGLFTDSPNQHAVTQLNNFAGISNADGSLKSYSSITDFVSEWIPLLTKNNDPLAASTIADFNTRLKANGYYTDSATTYGNNLAYYFNLLSGQ